MIPLRIHPDFDSSQEVLILKLFNNHKLSWHIYDGHRGLVFCMVTSIGTKNKVHPNFDFIQEPLILQVFKHNIISWVLKWFITNISGFLKTQQMLMICLHQVLFDVHIINIQLYKVFDSFKDDQEIQEYHPSVFIKETDVLMHFFFQYKPYICYYFIILVANRGQL